VIEVGLVGAGNLGGAVGQRLIDQGVSLAVFDKRPPAIVALVSRGAIEAKTLTELSRNGRTLLLCLPSREAVFQTLSEITLLPSGERPRDCIDLSTVGRSAAVSYARMLSKAGISYVEAPVSGGPAKALQGTLSIMVAGHPQSVQRVQPVLYALSPNVFHLGDQPGSAQMLKLVNNALAATNLAAAMEVVICGAKAGLDPKTMLDVINVSSGRNSGTEGRMITNVLPRQFSSGANVEIIHKDLKLFLDEAQALGVPTWIMNQVTSLWSFAMSQGDGQRDLTTLIHHLERWAGVEVSGTAALVPLTTPTSEMSDAERD